MHEKCQRLTWQNLRLYPAGRLREEELLPLLPGTGTLSVRDTFGRGVWDLPNAARGRVNHGLSLMAGKSLAEFRHVAQHAVHAIAPIGMRIDLSAHAGCFRPDVLAPDLAVAQEKALLRRESLDLGLGLAVQRLHQRHESQVHAAVVGRVFTQRELAVQMHIVHWRKSGIFFD